MDEFAPPSPAQRAEALGVLTSWLDRLVDAHPAVAAVVPDEETDDDRWFVRVLGESKDVYSVWFTLGQRTLAHESYVMPAPEERSDEFYEHLLVRNHTLRDVAFSVGPEAAVFLRGQLDLRDLTPEALDRILGSYYATIERCFLPALRIGFASRFD